MESGLHDAHGIATCDTEREAGLAPDEVERQRAPSKAHRAPDLGGRRDQWAWAGSGGA